MSMIITRRGYVIYYGYGQFDYYCVHVLKPKSKRVWKPRDTECFMWLKRMGKKYGNDKLYEDFLKIYEPITTDTDMGDIENIVKEVSSKYRYSQEWWIILALTIKAELHKKNTKLGKTIKHLGVYELLNEDKKVRDIVLDINDENWMALKESMLEKGIYD